jgi:hypothetical protein
MLSRETGHSRVPEPPHMITGMISFDMANSQAARLIRSIATGQAASTDEVSAQVTDPDYGLGEDR